MPKDKRLDVLLENLIHVGSLSHCMYHKVNLIEYSESAGKWVCMANKREKPKSTKCQGNIQKCELED